MSEVKRCIHGRYFCLECHAPKSEHGLKATLDAALAREAALREELESTKDKVFCLETQLSSKDRQISERDQMRDALQQRLTYAKNLLSRVYQAYGLARSPLWQEVSAALKLVEHAGKPPVGSVVTVHGSIKAIVRAHHEEGIIAGAGEGHLVKDGSYKP